MNIELSFSPKLAPPGNISSSPEITVHAVSVTSGKIVPLSLFLVLHELLASNINTPDMAQNCILLILNIVYFRHRHHHLW